MFTPKKKFSFFCALVNYVNKRVTYNSVLLFGQTEHIQGYANGGVKQK